MYSRCQRMVGGQTEMSILRRQRVAPTGFVPGGDRVTARAVAAEIDEQQMRADAVPLEMVQHSETVGVLVVTTQPVRLRWCAERRFGFVQCSRDQLLRIFRRRGAVRFDLAEMRLGFNEQPFALSVDLDLADGVPVHDPAAMWPAVASVLHHVSFALHEIEAQPFDVGPAIRLFGDRARRRRKGSRASARR